MNPLNRTVKELIACTNNLKINVEGKKLFQLVKHVTGKNISDHTDYEIFDANHYGSDVISISGKKGFISVSLEPLFQVI